MACEHKNHERHAHHIEELKAAFNAFDTNGDGALSADEIKNVVKKLGIQADDKELDTLFDGLDKNDDGKITFAEYSKVVGGKYYGKKDKNTLAGEFKKYDRDHNGYITPEELLKVLSKNRGNFTQDEAKALVAKADKDKDGKINVVEFLGLFD